MEKIEYCNQGDPYCIYPKCRCNTKKENEFLTETDMEFNQDYEDQQREADETINDFENW